MLAFVADVELRNVCPIRRSVSRFHQKATTLAWTVFFNKRSPAIAHAPDETKRRT